VTGNFRGPARPQDAPQPDDEPFPDDDDDWPDDGPGDPWSGPPQFAPGGPGSGPPPGKRNRWLPIALTAVLAGAVGVIVALLISGSPGTASANAPVPGSGPAAAPSLGGTGSSNGISGAPGRAGSVSLFIGGKVTAVTSHSITLSAQGHSVTAAINSSTRFTGQVHRASGIKAGDLAVARITGHGSELVAVTIQDPAQIP